MIEKILRERSEAMTTMLGEPQWQPSRSHVEALRNYMAEAAAEIERLQGVKRRSLAIADERALEAVKIRAENKRLRAALKPFSDIADLVEHTPRRDGERVYELPKPDGGYWTLVRADFRRARLAYEQSRRSEDK